ncbi:amino acid permease [candidate division KSB1 bacterium]
MKKSKSSLRLGTFEGVFTPTLLTILGVIMYLRLGWVVGNAGFGGALLIIILAKIVTITTGLALSSIATNTKIGAGGTYAMISRSLGAEVGSAVGIPLYLSQGLGAAMYIIGFSEGWLSIFPEHNAQLVSSIVLAFLTAVSFFGAKYAMKVQYLIILVIGLSLISFFLGGGNESGHVVLWGNFERAPFWLVFAIFFPAVTGVATGAAMSGDLKDPNRSLPLGVLSAIAVSTVIYILVAFWFDYTTDAGPLMENYTIMTDISHWKSLVLAGILGATLSSALGSIVAAPRTLMALGQDKVLPFSVYFARKYKNGEPLISLFFTIALIEISIVMTDLNTIAPLLTMFFLITYGMVNLVVVIEQGIGIPSFRPSLKIPIIIPLIGALWCLIIMLLINAFFASIATVLILIIYIIQVRRGVQAPWGDVRSGLFNALAEWAAMVAARLPQHAKSWKPNLLIPIESPADWTYLIEFVKDIVFSSGTLRVFSVVKLKHQIKARRIKKEEIEKSSRNEAHEYESNEFEKTEKQLNELIIPIKNAGIFAAAITFESHDFIEGVNFISRAMKGMFFPPNSIFLTLSDDPKKHEKMSDIIAIAQRDNLGLIILSLHPKVAFGQYEKINAWLSPGSPNINLSLLITLQLEKNWDADIKLITVIDDENDKRKANAFFNKIISESRMPSDTEKEIIVGDFKKALAETSGADINIFGISQEIDLKHLQEIVSSINRSCLFIRDSGRESIKV